MLLSSPLFKQTAPKFAYKWNPPIGLKLGETLINFGYSKIKTTQLLGVWYVNGNNNGQIDNQMHASSLKSWFNLNL